MFQQVSARATGLRRKALTTAVVLASVTAVGVTFLLSASVSSQVPPPPPRAGDPLPGLTAQQLQAFVDGLDEFTNSETPEGGLGPLFNQTSCVACHSAAGPGGSSAVTVTRFGRILPDGRFDPLDRLGGSLLQKFATFRICKRSCRRKLTSWPSASRRPCLGSA